MYLIYLALPARILFFIPLIICTIILRIRSYTDNCEEFMKYYDLCSAKYGDEFKNNFNGIMNITTYTLCVVIFFVVEIIYNLIIGLFIFYQK